MPGRKKGDGQVGLWHFRVHYEPYKPQEIIDFLVERAEVMIAVRETASRPHLHAVLTKFNQTKSTFCQQFLNKFPALNGNGSYSCAKKDDMQAQIRYCSKGESKETMPEVLHSQVDVEDYHKRYWEENDLLKEATNERNKGLQKDTSSVPKAKSKTWTEKVYGEINEIYKSEIDVIKNYWLLDRPMVEEVKAYTIARVTLFRYMMRCFGKAAKKVNNRIVQDIFDGFINGLIQQDEKAGEKYSDQLYKQIYG